jgi:CDP-diacylglycerol--glycerol-3-phosphate 3-phosphatidyltransferase
VPDVPRPDARPDVPRLNVANALSALRIVLAPVLLALAWLGRHELFLPCLVASLVSDILDGKIARRFHLTSEFGARLDSWGDLVTYSSVPFCAWWLRPEIVRSEAPFFWAVVAAYTVPVLVGFLKYRTLTSYHTRGAVLSAYLVGAATVVIFAYGPTWPLRFAAGVLVLAEIEEILITLTLPTALTNVPSLRHARALRRAMASSP